MLVNVKLTDALPERLKSKLHSTGVYISVWHNFHIELSLQDGVHRSYKLDYPEFEKVNCYGVGDSPEQILRYLVDNELSIFSSKDKKYVISMTPVFREHQSPTGGWRWHKWGEYIGSQNPQNEYLYDETHIDHIFVYHIYEVTDEECAGQPYLVITSGDQLCTSEHPAPSAAVTAES